MTWQLIVTSLLQKGLLQSSLYLTGKCCATGSSGPGSPHQRLTNCNYQRGQVCPEGAEISQSWDPLTCRLWRQRKRLCCSQRPLPRRKGASHLSHLGYIKGKNSPSSPRDLSLPHEADASHVQFFFMCSLTHWVHCIPALSRASPAALGNHSETQFPYLESVNHNSIHLTILLSGLNQILYIRHLGHNA